MATRLRKGRRFRGSRTCGWGKSGQHRESGRRGGFGRAGRYRHKKSYLIRHKEFVHMKYVGMKGFVSVAQKRKPYRSLNLIQLSAMIERLIEEKKVQYENQIPVVDLETLGFTKLLGSGAIVRPIRVKVASCSESAQKKIKDAGGEAILSQAT